eukprot:CAMPEP_0196728456 /NCGR_PEP_ID=MMETSP1091-20130531/9125_1 /TAXON_ID=302021 /ORGANISM="Rhodomonas sp., Strain CCMP768" /LENGTH=132 /DNA_ID=CAMNT_0042071205 /DNA_START=12 /DNA_END=410 /DNA_ORIENTATION=+
MTAPRRETASESWWDDTATSIKEVVDAPASPFVAVGLNSHKMGRAWDRTADDVSSSFKSASRTTQDALFESPYSPFRALGITAECFTCEPVCESVSEVGQGLSQAPKDACEGMLAAFRHKPATTEIQNLYKN